jgi:hypothetical protein
VNGHSTVSVKAVPRTARRIASSLILHSLASCTLIVGTTSSQTISSGSISMPTQDRLKTPGFWPTKGVAKREEYEETAECAKCHTDIAKSQATTPMAQASSLARESPILREHPRLSFRSGSYEYQIIYNKTEILYFVSDGTKSLSAPSLLWAFGLGNKGQTFLYSQNDSLYESRLSFYKSLQALDTTTGNLRAESYSFEGSLGRVMGRDEARRCFACHTSESTTDNMFAPDQALPGVICESCHGPGRKHVMAMKSGQIEAGRRAILNPRELKPVDSVDFCGACHRTWGDVMEAGILGVANVRFQPYRLENSRCWGSGNTRLTCIACHNPHEPLVHEAGAYDVKCLSCHISGERGKSAKNHPGAACPVSPRNCVTCHMPKVELPSMHATFTDHRIQIVRPGASSPKR